MFIKNEKEGDENNGNGQRKVSKEDSTINKSKF